MVFSMQGVGKLLCAVALMFCANVVTDTNWQWRIAILIGKLFGFFIFFFLRISTEFLSGIYHALWQTGAVPMLCAAYFRWKMHESEVYTKAHVESKPLSERFNNILKILWDNK